MDKKKPSYEEMKKKLARVEKALVKLKGDLKGKRAAAGGKRHTAPSNIEDLKEAYIASEQNFKNSMDASPLGIRIVTEDGDLIYANKAILDICGYDTPQELAAVPRSQLYTPESYKAHLERKRKRRLKEHIPLEYEIDIRRPDGEVRNLQVSRREVMWGGEPQFMAMYQDITEHKQAEEALKESEEKFHSIVGHSNDGIVFIQDGIVRYCNSKMLEISDYTEREVLGKPFLDFVAPEHKEMVLDIYRKRIAGKKVPDKYELNLLGKDNRKVFTEVSASLINYKQSQVDIVIVRDITGRKKAEEALADEAVRRRILVEQSSDGIVILDQDGKVYEANQRFADMLGYSMDEMQQLHVFDWEFSYPRERVVEMIRTVDEAGDHFETRHRRKDGTTYDVEISTNGAAFAGQKLIFCVCRDITERKRAEEVIHESEQRFRTLFETMAQGVIYHDSKGRVISANPAAERILGLTFDQMLGKTSLDPMRRRLHENGSALASEEHPSIVALRTGKPVNDVIMAIYNPVEEDYRWIINSAIPEFREGEEKPYRVYTTFTDITERKRIEQALRESEEKFATSFRASPAIVAITTVKDGKYLEINDSYTQVTGYSREELIGKNTISINIWENEKDRARLFCMLKEKGRVSKEEFDFRMKSGEIRTWLFSAEPINIGGEECLIGVSVDITERKQAEQALKESEERYRSTLDNMIEGCEIIGYDFRFLYVNDAAAQHLLHKKEDMLGHTITEIFPGVESSPLYKAVSRCLEKRVPENIEAVFPFPDGSIGYFSLGIQPAPEGVFVLSLNISERRKMQEEIERDRRDIKLILDTSTALIWYKDKDGRFLRVNKAFAEALKISEEDFIGKTVFDLYSADIAQSMTEDDNEVFTSGRPKLNIIEQYESAAGLRWVQTDKVPVLDKNGKPVAIIGFAQDITAMKQAEEATKESEEKFNKAFHASHNLMAIITLGEGKIIDVNDAYCTSTGYKREELIGHITPEISLLTNAEQREKFYKALVNDGKIVNQEVELYTKTGESRTFLFSAEIITLRGAPCVVVGALDITGRKQAEQRINYLNQTLRSIRNVNQLITREKDRDKLLQGVCDTLVESRSFLTAWIVLLDESQKLTTHAMKGYKGDFTPVLEEFKKGTPPPCAQKALKKPQVVISEDPKTTCVGCPIIDDEANFGSLTVRLEYAGNIYGVLCASLPKEILTDKNEASLFEEVATDIAFALYNIELQFEYERLEQERLRAAKLESIGTLAGGIAHDFNNLLTGIMGNIGLAKTYMPPSDAAYEMLDEAEKAALRARDLTQQLLTFARGGKPVKKSVNIAAIIKESSTFALRGSKVRQELSLPLDLWPIEADEGQISQVINNLVINADEAMPSGGTLKIQAENVTIKKTTIPLLPGGNYIRIDFTDTGTGISPEHLQRIFEPYFTTKQRGSGLGLTTAYSIVRNHGGTILADSKLNKGSTFHIYLPATKKTVKGGKKLKVESAGQAGGKVLVMDDEEMIRKMLKNMLTLAGYTVELSADGAEALEKYQQAQKMGDPFNAVIMDLTIPGGMGGREAVKKLLEIDPDATAIVSSGYATDPIMSEYKKYGFKAVIAKPYSVKQLQESLSSLLTKGKK